MGKIFPEVVLNSRLRDHRHQQNWTQVMMAEELGVTEITVRRWERGQTNPSPYYTKKLCDLFKKTPEDLGLAGVSTCVEAPNHEASELPPLEVEQVSTFVEVQIQQSPIPVEDQVLNLTLPIVPEERAMKSDRSPLRQSPSRLVWMIISAASLVLILAGSLFWGWQPSSARGTVQKGRISRISYYVCGDEAILTDINDWTPISAGTIIHNSDYSGPSNGYSGPSGNPARSSRNCSGRYQWAWNQSPVQAMWTWPNAYLPNGKCSIDVHIPSWYAGAPDALYMLTISSGTSSASYTFDLQDQDQLATTWITLHMQHQVPSIQMPSSPNNMYTLTLVLTNGEIRDWYLGADAIRFNCSTNL